MSMPTDFAYTSAEAMEGTIQLLKAANKAMDLKLEMLKAEVALEEMLYLLVRREAYHVR